MREDAQPLKKGQTLLAWSGKKTVAAAAFYYIDGPNSEEAAATPRKKKMSVKAIKRGKAMDGLQWLRKPLFPFITASDAKNRPRPRPRECVLFICYSAPSSADVTGPAVLFLLSFNSWKSMSHALTYRGENIMPQSSSYASWWCLMDGKGLRKNDKIWK